MNQGFLPLCKNCLYCKLVSKSIVKCSNGYYGHTELNEAELYSPFDFECMEFFDMTDYD